MKYTTTDTSLSQSKNAGLSSPALPNEIWWLILHEATYLQGEADKDACPSNSIRHAVFFIDLLCRWKDILPTRARISRVSRLWYNFTSPALYRSFFHIEGMMTTKFVATLDRSPHLARHIKRLSLRWGCKTPVAKRIVDACANATIVSTEIHHISNGWELQNTSQTLTVLDVRYPANSTANQFWYIPKALQSLQQLKTLILDKLPVHIPPRAWTDSCNNLVTLPQLTTLHLVFTWNATWGGNVRVDDLIYEWDLPALHTFNLEDAVGVHSPPAHWLEQVTSLGIPEPSSGGIDLANHTLPMVTEISIFLLNTGGHSIVSPLPWTQIHIVELYDIEYYWSEMHGRWSAVVDNHLSHIIALLTDETRTPELKEVKTDLSDKANYEITKVHVVAFTEWWDWLGDALKERGVSLLGTVDGECMSMRRVSEMLVSRYGHMGLDGSLDETIGALPKWMLQEEEDQTT